MAKNKFKLNSENISGKNISKMLLVLMLITIICICFDFSWLGLIFVAYQIISFVFSGRLYSELDDKIAKKANRMGKYGNN